MVQQLLVPPYEARKRRFVADLSRTELLHDTPSLRLEDWVPRLHHLPQPRCIPSECGSRALCSSAARHGCCCCYCYC